MTLVGTLLVWTILSAVANQANPTPQVIMLIGAAAAYVVGRNFGRTQQGVARVGAAIVLAVLLAFALSGPDGLSGGALGPPLGYGNANGSLYVLVVGAAILVAVAADIERVRASAALLAGAFFLLASITNSRAAMILAAGVLLIALAIRRLPRWSIFLGPVIVGATAGVTIVLGATNGSPIAGSLVEQLSQRRPQLWAEAMQLVRSEPLFGVGPGRFATTSPTAISDADARWAHSGYLQYAAELGIPAVALLALLLLWVMGALYLAGHGRVPIIGAAVVTAFSVHVAIDYVLHFPVLVVTAALVAGATSALRPSATR